MTCFLCYMEKSGDERGGGNSSMEKYSVFLKGEKSQRITAGTREVNSALAIQWIYSELSSERF